jgi:hypothetical protein
MNMRIALLALLAVSGLARAQVTTTLNASPTTGTCPLSVTLSWSSTGATGCTALDGWTGTKAVSGSQVVSMAASSTYTLRCDGLSGDTTLTWTPPTTNVGGTPLLDLAGYKVYHASTAAGVPTATPLVLANPTASGTVLQNLPGGPRSFGVKAYNSLGTESAMSTLASKTIVLASDTKSVTPTCNTIPNPPTGVSAVQTTALEIRGTVGNYWVARNVGTVPLGTACGDTVLLPKTGADIYEVPRSAVTFKVGQVKATSKIGAFCS